MGTQLSVATTSIFDIRPCEEGLRISSTMPRLVRRKPTIQRLKDYLNPGDWWLYLAEEFETADWDKQYASPLALGLHIVLLIARANTGSSLGSGQDDVFGDDYSKTGWLSSIATFTVYLLTAFSIANATYTFSRKRHYRLFESSIDAPQSTPSAHRVRVDSSPVSSSPLRFLKGILAQSQEHTQIQPAMYGNSLSGTQYRFVSVCSAFSAQAMSWYTGSSFQPRQQTLGPASRSSRHSFYKRCYLRSYISFLRSSPSRRRIPPLFTRRL